MKDANFVQRLKSKRRANSAKRRLKPSPREHKLRLESLENRAMLSGNPAGEGPYTVVTYDEYLENNIAVEAAQQQILARRSMSFDEMESYIDSLELQISSQSSDSLHNVLKRQFQKTLVDGSECCSLSQLEAQRACFDDYGLNDATEDSIGEDSLELVGQSVMSTNDATSGGLDPIYWPIAITSQVGRSSVSSSISLTNAIQERYDVANEELFDYIVVTAPALPDSYYSVVSIGGTARYGVDYDIFVSTSCSGVRGYNALNNTFVYDESGGSTLFYIVPLNDALVEQDETVTLNFGPIQAPISGGGDYYFDYISTSAFATIVDDDHWELSISAVGENYEPLLREYDETGALLPITLTEANEDECYFVVTRSDDGTNRSGDYSYPISFELTISGHSDVTDLALESYCSEVMEWRDSPLDAYSNGNLLSILSIPSYFTSSRLQIQSIDDSYVERLYEMNIVSVSYAYGGYSVEQGGESFRIVDNDLLSLNDVSFKENLNLISDTQGTIGTSWQNRIHWKSNDSTATLPVAYSCDDTLACQGTVIGLKDESLTYEVKATWSNDESDWITLSGSSALIAFSNNFLTALEGRQALYENHFRVTWMFRVEGEEERTFGCSDNPLYITYKSPLCNEIFHTVIHTACVAYMQNIESVLQEFGNSSTSEFENSDSTDQQSDLISSSDASDALSERNVFDAIWRAFSSRRIPKINLSHGVVDESDQILTYYGRNPIPYNSSSDSFCNIPYTDDLDCSPQPSLARQQTYDALGFSTYISGLLTHLDGTCDSWRNFAIAVFASQGIATSVVNIQTITDSNYGRYFFQVSPELLGQGSEQSPKENIWTGHALFAYDDIVWDPSYGIDYGNRNTALQTFISGLNSMGTVTLCPQIINNELRNYRYCPNINITISEALFLPIN